MRPLCRSCDFAGDPDAKTLVPNPLVDVGNRRPGADGRLWLQSAPGGTTTTAATTSTGRAGAAASATGSASGPRADTAAGSPD